MTSPSVWHNAAAAAAAAAEAAAAAIAIILFGILQISLCSYYRRPNLCILFYKKLGFPKVLTVLTASRQSYSHLLCILFYVRIICMCNSCCMMYAVFASYFMYFMFAVFLCFSHSFNSLPLLAEYVCEPSSPYFLFLTPILI